MRKTLLLLFALLGTMAGLAQTNLTSGKTVYPLGGLKSFLPEDVVTEDNLQKITQDGNTDNVFLFPQNGENLAYNQTLGIQGFYIDLGESKSIGAIQSTWEGADCGANIYVTDTKPADDGTLTGATLIATFSNAQEAAKNVGVTVENSGRYIVFVPTDATNFGWGVKIRTFAAFEKCTAHAGYELAHYTDYDKCTYRECYNCRNSDPRRMEQQGHQAFRSRTRLCQR